jgi:hypothetical protein
MPPLGRDEVKYIRRWSIKGRVSLHCRKRAPGALAPRDIVKGTQGPRGQTCRRAYMHHAQRPISVPTTPKLYTTVSCIEGRPAAGGELVENITGGTALGPGWSKAINQPEIAKLPPDCLGVAWSGWGFFR